MLSHSADLLSHINPLSRCLAQPISSLYFAISLRDKSDQQLTHHCLWGCRDLHSTICRPSFHLDKVKGSKIGSITDHYTVRLYLDWETSQRSSMEAFSPPNKLVQVIESLPAYCVLLLLKGNKKGRKKERKKKERKIKREVIFFNCYLFNFSYSVHWFNFFSLFLLSLLESFVIVVFVITVFCCVCMVDSDFVISEFNIFDDE
jgi:hypothetical protein